MRTNKLMLLLMLATVMSTYAQTREFTLEDLNFGGKNYHNMTPENRYLSWWGDELIRTDVDECMLVDKATGEERKMFSADDLNEWGGIAESEKILSLFSAMFPYPDQSLILAKTKTERVLIDFKEKQLVWRQSRVGETNEEWNAQSRAVAFVKDNNLYVTDSEGNTKQLTTDGSKEIVYAQSVHRDEFGIYKGTFWSPDGQKLAFYRMDQSMVSDYPLVDIDTRIATEDPIKYPMAGETSHKVTVGVYDLNTGKTIYLDAGDPTDRYFTNVSWSPDSKKIYMIELNRDQTDMELVSYDAESGAKQETLYKEHNDKYVHPMNPITFLPWDSSKFIMQSEKDGYNHLYLFDTTGKQIKQLTQGKWVVLDLIGFNTAKKSAIILSTESSDIQNNAYSVD
ncbi:MAG: DPP IV N-terminal domain-containing protein, partial [Prevotella sp.]|nr:DPP IV N-terminal domain-containing protein [Prevotella sp.]